MNRVGQNPGELFQRRRRQRTGHQRGGKAFITLQQTTTQTDQVQQQKIASDQLKMAEDTYQNKLDEYNEYMKRRGMDMPLPANARPGDSSREGHGLAYGEGREADLEGMKQQITEFRRCLTILPTDRLPGTHKNTLCATLCCAMQYM